MPEGQSCSKPFDGAQAKELIQQEINDPDYKVT